MFMLIIPNTDTLIATWRERGCASFWKVIKQFPFLRSHIVGWKACFIIHRVFRDGHPDVRQKFSAHTISVDYLSFLTGCKKVCHSHQVPLRCRQALGEPMTLFVCIVKCYCVFAVPNNGYNFHFL